MKKLFCILISLMVLVSAACAAAERDLTTPTDLSGDPIVIPMVDPSLSLDENPDFTEGFAMVRNSAKVFDSEGTEYALAGSGFVVYVTGVDRVKGRATVSFVQGGEVTSAAMNLPRLYPLSDEAVTERVAEADKDPDAVFLGGDRSRPLDELPESWLLQAEETEPEATETAEAQPDPTATPSLAELLNPDRSIDISVEWDRVIGHEATFRARLTGYENAVYTIAWKTSPDGETWTYIPGADGETMSVMVTEANRMNYWNVDVVISGVNE